MFTHRITVAAQRQPANARRRELRKAWRYLSEWGPVLLVVSSHQPSVVLTYLSPKHLVVVLVPQVGN